MGAASGPPQDSSDLRESLSAIDLLLARLLLKEVDDAFLEELARPAICDTLEALEPGFTDAVAALRGNAEAVEALACEYAELFLLPGGVSPFAAAWLEGAEGEIRSRLGHEIGALHDVLGVRPTDFGLGQVPDDHIGMLLALMAVALNAEPTADGGGLAGRAFALLEPWVLSFAEALGERATSPLYRATGALLREVVEQHRLGA